MGNVFAKKIEKSKQSINALLANIEQNSNIIFTTPTNGQEIKKLIMKLPNQTSYGYDNISNILLKEICPHLVDILADLIN